MLLPRLWSVLVTVCLPVCAHAAELGTLYSLGVGKADITGPAVEIGFMGYANPDQKGTGLRQRIYSRAFIVGNTDTIENRWVYVIADLSCGDTAIRNGVLEHLESMYGGLYRPGNVAIVGTHSHSGPGAWLNYLLPQITTLGFDQQSHNAVVDGIVLSIKRAHDSTAPGHLSLSKGLIEGANVNRSPYAYEANPAAERDQYGSIGGEVDKIMTALTFKRKDGTPFGQLNWFPVHGTSLYLNNTLVTGDNKGLAAVWMEKDLGNGFVAGFSQANVGDTSPNTQGAFCQDTGLPCAYENSTCNGRSQQCIGRGPAWPGPDLHSCEIVAQKQYRKARDLLTSSQIPILGVIRSMHTFVDFANYTFTLPNGTSASTCPGALGFSFAAGTTDGPGGFDFTQNDPDKPGNPMWKIVGGFLKVPSQKQVQCQGRKPILLDVGEQDIPYPWSPNIVDFQMFRVGNLGIIVSAGEATTMAGRRWKAALAHELEKAGEWKEGEGWVVLGGPANSYTHYITTPEEYDVQRYEGASTLYGPNTLAAYLSLTARYVSYLSTVPPNKPCPPGLLAPINTNKSISLIPGVVYDSPPLGKKFGDVIKDVSSTPYLAGQTVSATFVGANPRNNLRQEQTFVAVEKKQPNGAWDRVRDDADWDLVYRWKRTEGLTRQSEATVEWKADLAGTFRFKYYGDGKSWLGGKITGFEGTSEEFTVI
ncbi:Neutral/alkaline nonlysosomal ceramidase [Trichophaea hybrida]|nr:Neutral/alkaline nonlysosomal ceramidase [Trichophaea hybrida]